MAFPLIVALAEAVEFAASVLLSYDGAAGLSLHVAKPAFTLGSIVCKTTSLAAPVQSGNSTQDFGL